MKYVGNHIYSRRHFNFFKIVGTSWFGFKRHPWLIVELRIKFFSLKINEVAWLKTPGPGHKG